MLHFWHQARDGTMSRRRFRRLMARYVSFEGLLEDGVTSVSAVSAARARTSSNTGPPSGPSSTTGIEPTNNHAERELRGFVLWRKRSFGSQSDRGDRFAARIMTVAHSLRKQRRHVLEYLTEACQAALWPAAARPHKRHPVNGYNHSTRVDHEPEYPGSLSP